MRVFRSFDEVRLEEDSVLTLGAFDGIHLGHRALIEGVRRSALDQGRASAVVTFFPHPSVVLGRAEPFYLTSTEDKIALLNAIGIDVLVIMEFRPETTQIRAEDFLTLLINHLRMRELHVGYDFAFGNKREGNLDFLRAAAQRRGFTLQVVDALAQDGAVISSSDIRQSLRQGDVVWAARRLGRAFRLSGVAHGRQTINGLAAASLDVWRDHAMPANGLYACRAWVGNQTFKALTQIGTRSLEHDHPVRTVDVHLLDFDREITGMNVVLDFVDRLPDDPAASTARLVENIRQRLDRT
jgi:riboflavin kinase/FMN adenylyltransferase